MRSLFFRMIKYYCPWADNLISLFLLLLALIFLSISFSGLCTLHWHFRFIEIVCFFSIITPITMLFDKSIWNESHRQGERERARDESRYRAFANKCACICLLSYLDSRVYSCDSHSTMPMTALIWRIQIHTHTEHIFTAATPIFHQAKRRIFELVEMQAYKSNWWNWILRSFQGWVKGIRTIKKYTAGWFANITEPFITELIYSLSQFRPWINHILQNWQP